MEQLLDIGASLRLRICSRGNETLPIREAARGSKKTVIADHSSLPEPWPKATLLRIKV